MTSYSIGQFLGGVIGSLLIGLAPAILVSFVAKRFLSPTATAAACTIIGFGLAAVITTRDSNTGAVDWSSLPPVLISAVIVFCVWRWRIGLRAQEQADG